MLVAGIMLFGLSTRSTLDVNVIADRNPLFVVLSDGAIRNGYQVKILNKEHDAHIYRVSLSGLDGAMLTRPVLAGEEETLVHVPADSLVNARFFVSLPRERLAGHGGEADFTFVVTELGSGRQVFKHTTFRGPAQ